MDKKIIRFIGFSGSGKTTLIEKIVSKLVLNGFKVATVKHDVHGLDIDKENKDSYRYSKAGASESIVSSNELTVFKIHKFLSLGDIISKIGEVDLIIIEGYSNEDDYLTIQVARKETKKGFKFELNSCDAIVSDFAKEELLEMRYKGHNVFDINDLDSIYNYILNIIKC